MKDKMLRSINPSNGELVAEYLPHSNKEAEDIITSAGRAQRHWAESGFTGRATLMRRAARQLRLNIEKYSMLITLEMGEPLLQSSSEVEKCAAPVLMAGNGILHKHASNVTGCALAIEELFREAGFPEDLFRTLKLSSKEMEPGTAGTAGNCPILA